MVLVLVIGDLHIPHRIHDLPGNVCDKETLDYLRSIAVITTRARSAPPREMDVDVLISAHTHMFQATEFDGKFFLNPGTATGAWTGAWMGTFTEYVSSSSPLFADISKSKLIYPIYLPAHTRTATRRPHSRSWTSKAVG
ncbi:hypothetical protein EW145_g5479 [Phellinidium pouzarii]|uniref:Vacuolar protein sorting-associated protein 29 n=1 Tax=Phellinidium pouzarii TaxID=167371 RepID=A0A4V3XC50_9AGAM|nr:hypothetical protein EW145_g5479 [Phellinidium pouzarii]